MPQLRYALARVQQRHRAKPKVISRSSRSTQELRRSCVRCAGSARPSPPARVSQSVVSPPNAAPCRSRSWSVAARNILRPRSCAALRPLPKSRGANFAASGVRPNPSLSRDPTRQAAWASWRAGLCCTTPPKRLAARVAVSSNVRPHQPKYEYGTVCPLRLCLSARAVSRNFRVSARETLRTSMRTTSASKQRRRARNSGPEAAMTELRCFLA
jgi:hypothetical protein